MKTLLLLRHAKSSWKQPELADHDRPLNKRGKRDAPRVGELLRSEDLVPELIISSTAKRARQTAELVADSSGFEGEIVFNRDLYASGAEAYMDVLHALPEHQERVMVVGHNPDLEELIELLTGDYTRMPTAALAQVALAVDSWPGPQDTFEGRLVNIWLPRELGG